MRKDSVPDVLADPGTRLVLHQMRVVEGLHFMFAPEAALRRRFVETEKFIPLHCFCFVVEKASFSTKFSI